MVEAALQASAECDYRDVPFRWRKLDVEGAPPTHREGAALGFDAVRDRVLVFGGYEYPAPPGCPYRQDTWELRFWPVPAWTKIDGGSVIPRARSYGSGDFDPATDSLLVFGGANWCTGAFDINNPSDYGVNDTWRLDASSLTWSRVHPAGELPWTRWGAQAVLVPETHSLVVQGGYNFNVDFVGDTWELGPSGSGSGWARVAGHEEGPGERANALHWYDPERAMMVVAGGARCFGSCPTIHYRDTYGLTGLGRGGPKTWYELHLTSNIPHRFSGGRCAFDPVAHRATCSRGRYYPGPPSEDAVGVESYDTWTFTFEGPRSGRFEIVDTGGTWPKGRNADLMYDPKRDRFIAFGGAVGTGSAGNFTTTNEVWVLERDWTRAPCTPPPVHRP
ncbi:MAG: hypothetical protein AMXMBFR64_08240 [Myxococcales bacterium]